MSYLEGFMHLFLYTKDGSFHDALVLNANKEIVEPQKDNVQFIFLKNLWCLTYR